MQVIDDLNAIRTIEAMDDLIEKYENQACKVEADMVREMDWENEEVKHLFEMDDGAQELTLAWWNWYTQQT